MAPGGDASAPGASIARRMHSVHWESGVTDETEPAASRRPRSHPDHSGREGHAEQHDREHAAAEQLLMTAETYSRLLHAKDEELKRVQAKVALYEKSMATARDALTTAKDEIETLRGQLREAKAALEAREAEGEEMSAGHKLRMESCEAQMQSLKDLNTSYLHDVKRLQDLCAEQQQEARDRLVERDAQLAAAQQQVSALENYREHLAGMLEAKNQELADGDALAKEKQEAHRREVEHLAAFYREANGAEVTELSKKYRLEIEARERTILEQDAQISRLVEEARNQVRRNDELIAFNQTVQISVAEANALVKDFQNGKAEDERKLQIKENDIKTLTTLLQAKEAQIEAITRRKQAKTDSPDSSEAGETMQVTPPCLLRMFFGQASQDACPLRSFLMVHHLQIGHTVDRKF